MLIAGKVRCEHDSANGPARRPVEVVRNPSQRTDEEGLLEPCGSQEACTVLRGRGSGDIALLPDK